ncbi:MAG TPA: hypothetical protein VJN18_09580, partial [Polyangiaceae bacterium]|nr:hypothetical protein [Polyangiaceae bacterium]
MYSDRIANAGYAAYRPAFSEWLLDYPKRTGRLEDCLLSYEVYFVSDQSPQWEARSAPSRSSGSASCPTARRWIAPVACDVPPGPRSDNRR